MLHASDGATTLTGFGIFRDYGASETDVSLGRHVNSDGDSDFVALVSATFGVANSAPRVGPIVINEVHYHPQTTGEPPVGGDEYIELVNISNAPVSLAGWQFLTGVDYSFGNVTLAPGEYLVLTSVSPAAFTANPNNPAIPGGVQVVGPFAGGVLDNSGENIELYRPGPGGASILADRVEYGVSAPWPSQADGTGPSLAKLAPGSYGNDPINWKNGSVGGTPGTSNGSASLPGDVNSDGQINAADIDTLHSAINAGSTNLAFDLDGNSAVNSADATYLIETILGTRRGDANLDGLVNRADAATLGRNYGYTGTPAWAKGDFNGDGAVGVADVALSQADMGFDAPSPAASPSAPAAVIAGAQDGAGRTATRRASAGVRVMAPQAAIDQIMAESEQASEVNGHTAGEQAARRLRASRTRLAPTQAGVAQVDLSTIASEIRRVRRA